MTINDFRIALQKNIIEKMYIVEGNENYLIDLAISDLLKKSKLVTFPELNYTRIKNPMNFMDFKCICNSFPLMSEKRLVVIDIECLSQIGLDDFENFLHHTPDFLILVFIIFVSNKSEKKNVVKDTKTDVSRSVGALSKCLKKFSHPGQVINCYSEKNNSGFSDYLCQIAAKKNIALFKNDADFLCDYCVSDLSILVKELDKLLVVCDKKISKDDIIKYCIKSDDYKTYMLHEYLVCHDYKLSLELFESILIDNEKPVWLVSMLGKYLDLYIQVKLCREAGYSDSEIVKVIVKNTNSKDWQIKKAIKVVKNYSLDHLFYILHSLSDIDFKVKHGELCGNIDLYGLLIKIY